MQKYAIGGTIYPANTIVGRDTAGNFLFKFGHNATYPDPYYEAPAYRTGTSKTFDFISGTWVTNGWIGAYPDENTLTGITRNIDGTNVLAWEFDLRNSDGTRYPAGSDEYFYFVPGTAEDNGTWYHGTTAGTRSGRTISFGDNVTFDETNAFVSGLVPYGDIP